jgi:small subunit ribosomal protein S9
MAEKATKTGKRKYHEGVGRRKRAVARVRLSEVSAAQSVEAKGFVVNEAPAERYFTVRNKEIALAALSKIQGGLQRFNMTVRVRGGGAAAQAEAVRMGTARALIMIDESLRPMLKHEGYLRRDPREKERRKYGLKKARRAPQFSKR